MVGEFIKYDDQGNKQTYLNVNPSAMTYLLINATKEQQAEIENLKTQNTSLKQQNTELDSCVLLQARMMRAATRNAPVAIICCQTLKTGK